MPKGGKFDRMERHVEQSERAAGKSAKEAKRIGYATATKALGYRGDGKAPAKGKK